MQLNDNDEEGSSRLCCCCSSAGVLTKTVSAKEEWQVRNIQIYHLFWDPEDTEWRRKFFFWTVVFAMTLLSIQANFCFVALFLDVSYAGTYVEYIMISVQTVAFIPPILLSNVDTLRRELSLSFAADVFSAVVAVGFLFVIGKGFSLYGAVGMFGALEATYLVEPFEVFLLLNFGSMPNALVLIERLAFVFFIVAVVIYRAAVYLRQIDIEDAVVLDLAQAEPITLREVWLFFIDILCVRLIYISVERIERAREFQFSTFQALGKIE